MKSIFPFILITVFIFLFSCANDSSNIEPGNGDTGVAGSYARFLIVGDFMYVVDEEGIQTFDLSIAETPQQIDEQPIGERIESIFHFDGILFIGSGAGLYIYQIEADGIPTALSSTDYFPTFETFACDPVVANSTHAYVTLNSKSRETTPCGGEVEVNVNLLKVFDISDLSSPLLIAEYEMNAPKGVGLDGNTLFVCDDDAGLKVYDVSEPTDIQLIAHFDNITTYDVIPLGGLLLVVGPDDVYQFDYTDLGNIMLISQIPYGA